MITTITCDTLWAGRTGQDPTWFHPRACMVPTDSGPVAVMTQQPVTGNDVFHQVHWTRSDDLGKTWRVPEPIAGLDRIEHPGGLEEGVCDVVPEYHAPTGRILAMGHNVYYLDDKLTKPDSERFPVYVVGDVNGNWSDRRKLEWNDPRASAIYTSNCGQRHTLDNGDILVPVSFGPNGRRDRAVGTLLCGFDGETLTVKQATADPLRCEAVRGLLEPSVTWFKGRYYLTIRAEDGHGYVAVSDDGLEWGDFKPWAWEGRDRLAMSSTQQHWVNHSGCLYLVYTREAEHNKNVMRWRAPIYMARVEIRQVCLLEESEREVIPLSGDGLDDPGNVPRMGNFHVTNMTPQETWVTVGECLPSADWRGDTLLARIRWRLPNRLV